jgi:pentatricopeptide repeat protein
VRRESWSCVAAALVAALLAGQADAAAAKSVAQRLEQAAQMTDTKARQTEAIAACEQVLGEAGADVKEKASAFEIMIGMLCRQNRFDEAVKAADRMREMFPQDRAVESKALLLKAETYRQAKKDDEAMAVIQEFLKRQPDNKSAAAEAHLKVAEFLLKARRFAECCDEAAKVMELDPGADALVADALYYTMEALWQSDSLEKCAAVFPRLLEPKYLAKRETWRHRDLRIRYAQCLRRLKRYDEALAHVAACEKAETEPRQAAEWCWQTADVYADQNREDDAIKAVERVFTAYPQVPDPWWGAQRRIAEILAKKGDYEGAIRAARVCLDAAPDDRVLVDITRQMAEFLRSIDKNLGRANALINYQRFGPAGEDQKAGTDDDLKDPLEAFPRPAYPEREKAFAAARKQAGDDMKAMRYRAITYLYTCHPKEALRCFIDAFGRAAPDEVQAAGQEMILLGARAARGHSVGTDVFFHFVNYGPAGPDRKPGTDDDLADPFAPLLK